jgi:hypothetical protein
MAKDAFRDNDRLSRQGALVRIFIYATILAAATFAAACWASTLPAISPASLSVAFRSWTAIFAVTFHVWVFSFCVLAVIFLPVFLRPRR